MTAAYVDTSCLVAIAFGEPEGPGAAAALSGAGVLLSSNLLEAELKAALTREEAGPADDLLARIGWVLPQRPLSPQIDHALAAGYLRGADLWHLATALYVADSPGELPFFTLDGRQADVARTLGFPLPLQG